MRSWRGFSLAFPCSATGCSAYWESRSRLFKLQAVLCYCWSRSICSARAPFARAADAGGNRRGRGKSRHRHHSACRSFALWSRSNHHGHLAEQPGPWPGPTHGVARLHCCSVRVQFLGPPPCGARGAMAQSHRAEYHHATDGAAASGGCLSIHRKCVQGPQSHPGVNSPARIRRKSFMKTVASGATPQIVRA